MNQSIQLKRVLLIFGIGFSFILLACVQHLDFKKSTSNLPRTNHDLSYIPFDKDLDRSDFVVCDSTAFQSGRNRLQYIGGNEQLKQDIRRFFESKDLQSDFSGYVIIRFLHNCHHEAGRYRLETLNPDFSKSEAPTSLRDICLHSIKRLDAWKKAEGTEEIEYYKYVNLKLERGEIQHILL